MLYCVEGIEFEVTYQYNGNMVSEGRFFEKNNIWENPNYLLKGDKKNG